MNRLGIRLIKVTITTAFVIILCSSVVYLAEEIQSLQSLRETKDWHDNITIAQQLQQEGLGENGAPVFTHKSKEKMLYRKLKKFGMNALVSERISINRSVPDVRESQCKNRKYLKKLPNASIIISFFDENWSTLLRTCHSIINRSPPELIQEIILIDDFSSSINLHENLKQFIKNSLPKVKLITLPKRHGQIKARLTGAKEAIGEVLVFLDSHVEVSYNWLPPLLEPIAFNPNTVTCPSIDLITFDTFAYKAISSYRGAFDRAFNFLRYMPLENDQKDLSQPHNNPIMGVDIFAIKRDFFWELGGYDENLQSWAGDRFEISFKIWMCGGKILNIPCSRLGHVHRGFPRDNDIPDDKMYILRIQDFKRISEVWLDDYKKVIYESDPELYKLINPGDLSTQKALREKLQCKSFDWFLSEVAFESLERLSYHDRAAIASGSIMNIKHPKFCIGYISKTNHAVAVPCSSDRIKPNRNQNWILNGIDQIRVEPGDRCLYASFGSKRILLRKCLNSNEDFKWLYHPRMRWLINIGTGHCIDFDPDTNHIILSTCSKNEKTLEWSFGYENETAVGPLKSRKERMKYYVKNYD